MAVFEDLQARIKNDLGIEAKDFCRLHPGKSQRSVGSWLWTAKDINGLEIGSIYTPNALLKAKRINCGIDDWQDILIWPENRDTM